MAITFRLMTRDDLPLVHEWHQRPHVARWWTARTTFEETEAHYVPTIEGTEPTQHYLALLDGEPLGMIQTYLVSDYPDYAALIEEGEGLHGRPGPREHRVRPGLREGGLPSRQGVRRPGGRAAARARPARAQLM